MGALLQAGEFPFRCEFSLSELVRYWQRDADAGGPVGAIVRDRLAAAPELLDTITDRAVIDRHRPLVDLMMSVVFPAAFQEDTIGTAVVPFHLRSLYGTSFMERHGVDEGGRLRGRINLDPRTALAYKILHAYALVLGKFYGITLEVDYPVVVTVDDEQTGGERYLKMQWNSRFLAIESVGEVPKLDDEMRQRVLANLSDPWTLMTLVPPDRFVFRGFAVLTGVDVTSHEILSAIKRELIERESVVSSDSFQRLAHHLRAYLRRPGLDLGLAAFAGEQIFLLGHGGRLEHGCIYADSSHYTKSQFSGSIFERAVYVRNLRLWQLMVTCGIAARTERLKACCVMPLDTTHLVLVQHTPLAIRFRFDEKRFDVDGAYNARYEIVKKRIDKATVRGGAERVTQPGHIAIVYGHPAEGAEYREYIEYLQSLGCLRVGVEELELDELQGVRGLRALRVGVDLASPRLEKEVTSGELDALR